MPANPDACRHLLAPLVLDPKEAKRLQVRNYRECKSCGASLWDDGSLMKCEPEDEEIVKDCKSCKWAIWGNRTDIPEHERKFWGDCTYPGPVPAVYNARYIMAANVEENCPTWESASQGAKGSK